MATFPALAPSTRAFTPGGYPHTPFTSMSGEQSRVRHSTAVLASRLELTYVRLSQDDRQAIEIHYHGQQGEFVPFTLSPQVFSGFVPTDVDPAGQWRYAEPPEVEDHCGPTATVKVVLVSVPGGAPGAQAGPVVVSILAGQPANVLPGAARTITITFSAGAASATNPAGPLLLLHMEGTGTTIVDSSAVPKTIALDTADVQDITQSTTEKKFGSKGLYFPSGNSWLEASTFAIAGGSTGSTVGAVTIEMFCWFSSQVATDDLTHILDSDGSFMTAWYRGTNPSGSTGIGLSISGGASIGTLATETWHYIKITRATNGVLRRFVNGTEYYTGTTHYSYAGVTVIQLGSSAAFDGVYSMKGYLDEVRIRPEVDNSLTVPTEAFPDP